MIDLADCVVKFDCDDPFEDFAKDKLWKPWMDDVTFYCLNTMDAVKEYLEAGIQSVEYIAADTETTGLNVKKAKIVGFSFSYREKECAYVPLRHTTGLNVDHDEFLEYFRSVVPRTKWIWYNSKYDAEVLHFNGVFMKSGEHFKDAMLNVCLHDSNRAELNAGLKGASKNYLGRSMIAFKDVCPHANNDSEEADLFPTVDLKLATLYAGSDALNTLDLYNMFQYVEDSQKLIYDMETQLIDVVRDMERNGICIDVKYFKVLEKRIQGCIDRLSKDIFDLCDKKAGSFCLDSPKQVGKVFFEEMKIPNPYLTEKSGQYKTSGDVMEALADETGHPVLLKYKEYKKKQKLLSSYILPFVQDDSLSKANIPFKQFTKATGRFAGGGGGKGSHYLPINVQSIPAVNPGKIKDVKIIDTTKPLAEDHYYYEHLFEWDDQLLCDGKCEECPFNATCVREEKEELYCSPGYNIRRGFISSGRDKQIFTIDFSGVELRMVANISGEDKWIQEFLHGEGDLHSVTAMDIFGITDRRGVEKKQRGLGKTVNFGSLYGGGPGTLVRTVNKDSKREDHITKAFAKDVLENFWSGIPTIDKWRHSVWQKARNEGAAHTYLGRKRPIPESLERADKNSSEEEKSRIQWLNAKGDRNSANHVVQGSSADLMKIAMLKCSRRIKSNGWEDKVKILLTVHDELVFESDTDVIWEAMSQMADCMEVAFPKFPVPFVVDIEFSDRKVSNWGMTTECGVIDGKIYPTKYIKAAKDAGVEIIEYMLSIGQEFGVDEAPKEVLEVVVEESEVVTDSDESADHIISDASNVSVDYDPKNFNDEMTVDLSRVPRTRITLNILQEIVRESRGSDTILLILQDKDNVALENINVNDFSRKCDIYLSGFF